MIYDVKRDKSFVWFIDLSENPDTVWYYMYPIIEVEIDTSFN